MTKSIYLLVKNHINNEKRQILMETHVTVDIPTGET